MTTRLVAGLGAITLAIGVLVGATGTVLLRDDSTRADDVWALMADHMADGRMSAPGMMGSGSMLGSGSMMDHLSHHATSTPVR